MLWKRTTKLLLLISMLLLCLYMPLSADTPTLKIGVYDDPPAIMRQGDIITGIYPKLFNPIFDRLGVKYEYHYGTWDEIFNGLKSGQLDMIYDIAYSEERSAYFDFSKENIISSYCIIFSRKNQNISSLLDLEGKRVAVVKNDISYEGQKDSLKETLYGLGIKCKFVETGGFSAAIQAAEDNKADACVVNRVFADYRMISSRLTRTPIVYKPVQVYVAFKKDSELGKMLIPKIDAALSEMKSNPESEYFKVIDSYFTKYTVVQSVPDWLWEFGIGALIISILAFFAYHNISLRRQVNKRTKELQEVNAQLKELSSFDSLTGLYNRRVCFDRLTYEIARAKRYNSNLSLAIFDADHFKQVNDLYGHSAGDKVLARVAQIIKGSVREVDTTARFGGEEFIVILPETGIQNAVILADKIRQSVENANFDDITPGLKITVTGGVAQWDYSFADADAFFEAADKALYKGKDSGRNMISC